MSLNSNKGFILLGNIIVFLLSALLMLAALRTYHICLVTMRQKILLEKAIALAEANDSASSNQANLFIKNTEKVIAANLIIKEVQICHNEKIIFSLAEAK